MGILSDSQGKVKKIPFGQRRSGGSFGKKKVSIKARSKKVIKEKIESNPFYEWIHGSGQVCVVCGCEDITIHHITDLKKIDSKRREWDRVVVLCKAHHQGDSMYAYNGDAIHKLSKEEFYRRIMSFEELMVHSDNIYKEYLEYNI